MHFVCSADNISSFSSFEIFHSLDTKGHHDQEEFMASTGAENNQKKRRKEEKSFRLKRVTKLNTIYFFYLFVFIYILCIV